MINHELFHNFKPSFILFSFKGARGKKGTKNDIWELENTSFDTQNLSLLLQLQFLPQKCWNKNSIHSLICIQGVKLKLKTKMRIIKTF